jgi:hypothetical protein
MSDCQPVLKVSGYQNVLSLHGMFFPIRIVRPRFSPVTPASVPFRLTPQCSPWPRHAHHAHHSHANRVPSCIGAATWPHLDFTPKRLHRVPVCLRTPGRIYPERLPHSMADCCGHWPSVVIVLFLSDNLSKAVSVSFIRRVAKVGDVSSPQTQESTRNPTPITCTLGC